MKAIAIAITLLITGCKAQQVKASKPPIPGIRPIALCNDGTFSYAMTERLACLDNCVDHGGVKQWYPFGKQETVK